MASTRQSSRAELVASNAQARADGGFIFADAPNAVTLAAVIAHQISMHRNITPLPVTRLSRVSSRASGGFTTIVQGNSSPVLSSALLTRIRWINRRPDRREGCRQIGKRCFTNRMPRNPYLGAVKLGVRGHSRQARVIRSIEIGLKRSERFVP